MNALGTRFATPRNFTDHIRTPLLRRHWVYRAFNEGGELLYVGATMNPEMRRKEHAATSVDWFPLAVRFALAGPYNYETARQVERDAIGSEGPLFNMTPGRRAVAHAHSQIQGRWLGHYLTAGVPLDDAIKRASRKADSLVAAPDGRSAWRHDGEAVLNAKRANRVDAMTFAGAAA